jgi:hypothetical protein
LNFGDVHHRGFAGRHNQQIKIAFIGVATRHHRAKYPDIGHAVTQCNAADGFAVGLQCHRGSHSNFSLVNANDNFCGKLSSVVGGILGL